MVDSVGKRFRQRRFNLFLRLVSQLDLPLRILDIGGTQRFWEDMRFKSQKGVEVVLFNPFSQPSTLPNFSTIEGDARDLSCFKDKEFDVVFSNATLEHIGSFSDQKKVANEIRRVGKRYFIQVPSYWFPLEPHFLLPGFQFLPKRIQKILVSNFSLGRFSKSSSLKEAEEIINSIRLLKFSEMRLLFPEAKILVERFLFWPKSYLACFGWPENEIHW
ncbi:class I SAM-dependent methyltransferase [bacterium]|nr:class I SAM-dependent methyltransferase [bacterium]